MFLGPLDLNFFKGPKNLGISWLYGSSFICFLNFSFQNFFYHFFFSKTFPSFFFWLKISLLKKIIYKRCFSLKTFLLCKKLFFLFLNFFEVVLQQGRIVAFLSKSMKFSSFWVQASNKEAQDQGVSFWALKDVGYLVHSILVTLGPRSSFPEGPLIWAYDNNQAMVL